MKLYLITLIILVSVNASAQQSAEKQPYIVPISDQSYDREIATGMVMVEYRASWSTPCGRMESILKEISVAKDLKIGTIDIDKYETHTRKYGVNVIPTLILYKDGVEVKRISGEYTKQELLQFLKPYVN